MDNQETTKTVEDIQTWLIDYMAEALSLKVKDIQATTPFKDYGLDSSASVILTGDLGEWLDQDLAPTLLLDHKTIKDLANHLTQ